MKYKTAIPLSVAALTLSLALPKIAVAGELSPSPQNSANQGASTSTHTGMTEAVQMVPAQAALDQKLDAKKATPGEQFRATLAGKVHLKNGTELPSGTVLWGEVAKDDMNESGTSKLALSFTQAKLKNGSVIPIKATIVGIYGPDSGAPDPYPVTPGDQVPSSWNDGTLQVDQIGALAGVDLHSRISSRNSGVLTTNKKDDIKLGEGTEFSLAIAPARQNG